MNYTPSGYPSSYQGLDLSKYETEGQPSHNYDHLPKIEGMIQESIMNNVPQMIQEQAHQIVIDIMRQLIPSMIGAIHTDITSIVRIAFSNAKDIFEDSRTQAYITDNITKSIESKLNDLVLTITF